MPAKCLHSLEERKQRYNFRLGPMLTEQERSMLSSKLEVRDKDTIAGKGLTATKIIEPGELLWQADANSPRVTLAEWKCLSWPDKDRYSQCGDDRFVRNNGIEWAWNHSCDPNCTCDGLRMFALQRIQPDEEVTYDYGFCEIARQWRMACQCGTHLCRGMVCNKDILLPSLQRRYRHHIPPYVQRAIDGSRWIDVATHVLRSNIWGIVGRVRRSLNAGKSGK
jgi:hypothetical protein